jgi:hypothetical protein
MGYFANGLIPIPTPALPLKGRELVGLMKIGANQVGQ